MKYRGVILEFQVSLRELVLPERMKIIFRALSLFKFPCPL